MRLATYRKRPSRSETAAFGSYPAGSVRRTLSEPVSISETVSLHEFVTYSRLPPAVSEWALPYVRFAAALEGDPA